MEGGRDGLPQQGEKHDEMTLAYDFADVPAAHALDAAFDAPFFEPAAPLDPFYHTAPRFLHAVDAAARTALRDWYADEFARAAVLAGAPAADPSALDLCASWAPNYPPAPLLERAAGVGLCAEELERAGFDEWHALDICATPLPFPRAHVHVVTLAFGLEYLRAPVVALREAARVLAPGGTLFIAWSDRIAAPERAGAAWRGWSDATRVAAAARWARAAGFVRVEAADISPLRGVTDALVLVRATAPR